MKPRFTQRLLAALDRLSGLSGGPAIKGRKHRVRADVPSGDTASAEAALLAAQADDGSYGGDPARTAAALAALALIGHTRERGAQREAVRRAASWLGAQDDAMGALAIELLTRVEAGEDPSADARFAVLGAAGTEGHVFASFRDNATRD